MGKIYETFKLVTGDGEHFSDISLKKIIYNLVKSNPNKSTYYSVETGNDFNQFGLHKDGFLLQVDERHESELKDEPYIIIINGGTGNYNYFGTKKFNELFELF